jgi:hypothetical protein
MNTFTIVLILVAVVITGIVISLEIFKTNTNAVFRLSVTTQTSPNNIKIHTQQQISNIDDDTTILDNSTLDKIPVLKNSFDNAFNKFLSHPLNDVHTFSTQILQSDTDSIIQLAGNKVNHLSAMQINDINFGINFTSYTSAMEFKLNNFYYHVVIEQLIPSQGNIPDNVP